MTDSTRAAFEAWYAVNAFDYERNPIGSRECGLQWASWQAARKAALEEAAKVCESMIDRDEAIRTEKRIRAAIATNETDDELRALRHASSVGLHNGALERAANAIRALADGATQEGAGD